MPTPGRVSPEIMYDASTFYVSMFRRIERTHARYYLLSTKAVRKLSFPGWSGASQLKAVQESLPLECIEIDLRAFSVLYRAGRSEVAQARVRRIRGDLVTHR
jgi:hypothetical protein